MWAHKCKSRARCAGLGRRLSFSARAFAIASLHPLSSAHLCMFFGELLSKSLELQSFRCACIGQSSMAFTMLRRSSVTPRLLVFLPSVHFKSTCRLCDRSCWQEASEGFFMLLVSFMSILLLPAARGIATSRVLERRWVILPTTIRHHHDHGDDGGHHHPSYMQNLSFELFDTGSKRTF